MPRKRRKRINRKQEEHYRLLQGDKEKCICLLDNLCLCYKEQNNDAKPLTPVGPIGVKPLFDSL